MTSKADAVRFLVAHLYQRSGRPAMSENELANAMSLDLKWYPPKDARALVVALAREGHLARNDDGDLEPMGPVKGVKVPLAFRPPPGLVHDLPDASVGNAGGPEGATGDEPVPAPASEDHGPDDAALGTGTPTDGSPTSGLGALLDALARETGEEPGVWVGRMDAVIQASADGLVPQVALLLAAAERGIDVSDWYADARAALAP